MAATNPPDVVLVGAGIMSATLAVLLKELDPNLKIEIHEVLDSPAQESSNAWNNAGTGHAALCELNYTPEEADGSINISKALQVNTEFDLSRQFWSYLVTKGAIRDPQAFLHAVPHMSFVRGAENRDFLKKRYKALTGHHLYHGMEYTEDKRQLQEWVPLVMEGRDPSEIVTATRMVTGTDVDYGSLTNLLLDSLNKKDSRFSFTAVCRTFAAMATRGRCESGTSRPERSATFRPSLSSSARVEVRCRCCNNREFPKDTDMPVSR